MKREISPSRMVPEAMVLIPLLPMWALAMFATNGPIGPVALVGAVAVSSGLLFGRILWRHASTTGATGSIHRLIHHGIAITGCAVLWVWLQYALNPFRMRGTFDALLVSRSAPWQLAAGLYLFGSIIIAARLLRSRAARHSTPEAAAKAPALTHLAIRVGDRTTLVDVRNIERIQACDDHVAVTAERRCLIASYRMSDLIGQLDPNYFIRIHRSHIVNLSHVRSIQRVDANRDEVILKSGESVTASRAGSIALRKKLVRGQ
jgi:DNA-binding LytR/AlgR family response regulator